MNMQEFMNDLKMNLKNLDKESVDEILSDFSEHFNMAIATGKSEDDICKELGDPIEIAEQFNEESGVFTAPDVINLSDINIALYSVNLHLSRYRGTDFNVKIIHHGMIVNDNSITITENNDGLEIMQARPEGFVQRFINAFDFKTIHVEVPDNFNGNIRIKMAHGNLNLDEIIGKSISAEVISGNTKFSRVSSSSDIGITCFSGNVHLKSCVGEASITDKSGNITIESHSGSVNAFTSSGNIKTETDCMKKNSKTESKSGNIKLEIRNLQADLDVQGHSGNVDLTVYNLEGNISAKTKSGNVKAYFDPNVKAVFSLQSSEIKSDFASAVIRNSEIPIVNLSTRSGNVRVKKI